MEEKQQRQVFGLVLPFLRADRDGVGVLLRVAAVSRTLRGLVAEDERLWRTLHLARARSSTLPAVAFHHSWLRSFWCHAPQSAGEAMAPASLLQAAPSTALLAEAHATRKLGKLPTSGDKEANADDRLQVALVAVADFSQHEFEEGTPALIEWPGASAHPFIGPVHEADDWPLTLSPDMSAFARDSYFVPSPSYACFRDTSQRAPADGQECKLMMTLRDFVHYAEHNRDEEPLCVVHDLSVGPGHSRTFAPRNVPFFTGDLFDVLDKRPPKDFLCIEPIGGGAAWHQSPYGQSVLDLLVEGSRRWSFYPPAYRPPGVRFHLSEEEEEANEVVSPYTTPPALRWLKDVYPNLTDDDYQPIECIQNAGQALFVPAGWWMASVSVGQSASISLRSHYASATQLDELCSTLPPPLLVRLKNRLWDCQRPDLVQQIDCCMGTPGRLEVVQVLRKIANLLHSPSSATDCEVTDRVDRARLPTFDDQDDLSGIVEAQRHSHLNPTFVVENRLVVKFYHRRALGHHHRESALLRYFASLPASAWETPRLPVLYAQGALKRERGAANVDEAEEDGADEDEDRMWEWPYLVVSYVEGETLEAAWDRMAAADKEAMASELGRLTAFVHAMPLPTSPLRLGQPPPPNDTYGGAERLPDSWDAFVRFMQTQRRNCVQQHRQWASLPPHLLAQLDDYLPPLDTLASFLSASSAPPPNDAAAAVWLHSDLTATNLIMRAADRCAAADSVPAWEVGGLIDFGDAKVGHRIYDFVALHVLVFRCDKPLLRRFFLAYGATNLPSHGFAYTAMCLSLLHEHDIIGAIARIVPDFTPSLHQLATLLWEYETT